MGDRESDHTTAGHDDVGHPSFYMNRAQRHSCYSRPLAMSIRSRQTFQQLVTLPDGAIPLAEAALLMACEEYPQLIISPYLDQLDDIAAQVKSTMVEGDSPLQISQKINDVLFEKLGFAETRKITTTRATASSMTSWNAASGFRSRCRPYIWRLPGVWTFRFPSRNARSFPGEILGSLAGVFPGPLQSWRSAYSV